MIKLNKNITQEELDDFLALLNLAKWYWVTVDWLNGKNGLNGKDWYIGKDWNNWLDWKDWIWFNGKDWKDWLFKNSVISYFWSSFKHAHIL